MAKSMLNVGELVQGDVNVLASVKLPLEATKVKRCSQIVGALDNWYINVLQQI